MVKQGYRTMQLRRGKPARTYQGTQYLPGVPIDPSDPNLQDPAFKLQLEGSPHLFYAEAPEPAPFTHEPPPAEVVALDDNDEPDDDDQHALDFEEDQEN